MSPAGGRSTAPYVIAALMVIAAIGGMMWLRGRPATPLAQQSVDHRPAAPSVSPVRAAAAPAKVHVAPGKFDTLYRAMKSIEGATAVGVNYLKFSELLQAAATEVLVAKDAAKSEDERKVLAPFVDALQAYRDSATVWQRKNDSASESATAPWAPNIMVAIVSDRAVPDPWGLVAISDKYGVPVATLTSGPLTFKVIPEQAMQLIWQKAAALLDAAVDAYQAAQS